MWNKNGVLICGTEKRDSVKTFDYEGMCAYWSYPLLTIIGDEECLSLSEEHCHIKTDDNMYIILEFISNPDLYERYLNKCKKLGIGVRVLFLESEYDCEIWQGGELEMEFLGYEYCPVCVDDQVITDIDWYKPFEAYKKRLNKYGLFDTYEEAVAFVADYKKAEESGDIGDGGFDGFIFKVYEVKI